MSRPARRCVAAVAGVLLAACGQREPKVAPEVAAPHPVIAALAQGVEALAPGSRLLRLDAADPELPGEALAEGFAAAGAPSVHHAGERYCFLARAQSDGPVQLYMAALSGGPATPLEATVDERSAPAWLADGCIVYAAPALDGSRALFCIDPEGGTPQRITFSGTDAADPCVLHDGRVLFAGVRTTPEGTQAPALFAVHPDGIGLLLFHGATPAVRYARPRQRRDGSVVFRALAADGTQRAWILDWRAPAESALPLADGSSMDVAPASLWPDLPIQRVVDAAPRPRPQGHSTLLDYERRDGTLLCTDARRGLSDGAAYVLLHARLEDAERGAYAWTPLGRVALEADGSFFAVVPADTPLRLDVLGADGAPLRTSRTPFWVRPGEIRGCTGCHDAPDTTPPNRQPAAALRAPVRPLPAPDGGGR